jgi:ADP-heptose:LPS heptosyltransferase
MKPKLLYFSSDGLGENIFATPTLKFLSEHYDIDFVIKEHYSLFFENYKFIKLIKVPKIKDWGNIERHKDYFSQYLNFNEYDFITSHFQRIVDNCKNLKIDTISNIKNVPEQLSCCENYLQKFGGDISSQNTHFCEIDEVKFDGFKKIILYMGSNENIRRLPVEYYNEILKFLNYNFSDEYKIYCIYNNKYESEILNYGIHLKLNNSSEDSKIILDLFKSGVSLMIGPDSGLTQVALTFKIPQIWIETRDRLESIIPKYYYNIIKVFRSELPNCLRHCKARTHFKLYGSHIISKSIYSKEAVEFENLPCKNEINSHCLTFSSSDYKKLNELISSLLI